MMPLPGTLLPHSPLTAARWVRDLVSFDGPLLTEFRNQAGEPFLFSWCDRDDAANRWLAFRVQERDMIRFTMRSIGLRYLMENTVDGLLYVVDIDAEFRHHGCSVIAPTSLPEDYRAEEGAVLPPVQGTSKQSIYAALLNGVWGTKELSEFPTRFQQAYLALYAYGNHGTRPAPPVDRNSPWKGGYSAVHFYNKLYAQTPAIARPQLKALVYASPGYTKWHLDPDTANALREAIEGFKEGREVIHNIARAAYETIHDYGLNAADAPVPASGSEIDAHLGYLVDSLVEALGSVDGGHVKAVHGASNFICLKIVLSIYKRLQFLFELSAKGMVEY
jgi:hypothetical protein